MTRQVCPVIIGDSDAAPAEDICVLIDDRERGREQRESSIESGFGRSSGEYQPQCARLHDPKALKQPG